MNFNKTIIVGTRKSSLAMRQTQQVIRQLKKFYPGYKFVITGITTSGDRLKDWAKTQLKGLFVKEIEEALISGRVDLGVHSMKDLPCDIPPPLEIAAMTKRLNPQDVLISLKNRTLKTLRPASVVGTSSLRRKFQILAYRQDLKVLDIRGNLDTRIRKVKEGKYDAIVVAAAGILRFGLKNIAEFIPTQIMLPAPGQGVLGIEIRKNDQRLKKIVKVLNDETSFLEVTAERAFLKGLGGGCRTPIAALAKIEDGVLKLEGVSAGDDEKYFVRCLVSGKKNNPELLGMNLAGRINFLLGKMKRWNKSNN